MHNEQLNLVLDPAGNISMSLPDYTKFIQAQLAGLQGASPYMPRESFKFLLSGLPEYAIGWGWKYDEKLGVISNHNGSAGTFFCTTAIVHDKNFAITIIINAADPQIHEVVSLLREHLFKLMS